MKPVAAKEQASQLARSRLAHRASGPTLSYPKTRVRGSRLFEVAFILTIVELTRRLHQAYEHAYDKQAADWLLPQNSDRRLTTDETSSLRNAIADLLSDPNCLPFISELLAKAAEQNKDNLPFSSDPLKLFDEIRGKGGYNYSARYGHNTVLSNLQHPNAAVILVPRSSYGPASSPAREQYIADEMSQAGLHETLHLAGRNRQYSDEALAGATLAIAAAHGWKLPSEADRQKILSDRFQASFYWGGILRSKCKPSSKRR